MHNLYILRSKSMHIIWSLKQWWFCNMPHLRCHGIFVYLGPMSCKLLYFCRAFSRGTVIIYLDLKNAGLQRPRDSTKHSFTVFITAAALIELTLQYFYERKKRRRWLNMCYDFPTTTYIPSSSCQFLTVVQINRALRAPCHWKKYGTNQSWIKGVQ